MKNTIKSCRLLNFFKYFFGGENPSLLILLLFLAGLLQVEKAFERAFADSKAFSNLAFEKPLS